MTNLKLVLRTYSALRQMSSDDIALLETLCNFNDTEREAFVEALMDKPATKKAGKKSSTSKSSQSSTKSTRASGIHAQLNRSLSQQRAVTTKDDDDDGFCRHRFNDGKGHVCGLPQDHNIHHLENMVDYHPFVSVAPPAPAPSPANGGAESSTANSGTEVNAASNVHHAGG